MWFTIYYRRVSEKQIHTFAFMIALSVCFLFPVQVSTREDRPLQFNRATFFALLALALTGMAQASGREIQLWALPYLKNANRAIKLETRRKTVSARN